MNNSPENNLFIYEVLKEREALMLELNNRSAEEKPVYLELLQPKKSGKTFTIEDLSVDLMITLFEDELCTINDIAALYNTTYSKLKYIKSKYRGELQSASICRKKRIDKLAEDRVKAKAI